MNILDYNTLAARTDNMTNTYQDFSTKSVSTGEVDRAPHINIEKEQPQEDGDSLAISKESSVAAQRNEAPRETVSHLNYGTNFSTKATEEMVISGDDDNQNNMSKSSQNSDDILNQYRFFVQSYQYQDADGAVKRIFR